MNRLPSRSMRLAMLCVAMFAALLAGCGGGSSTTVPTSPAAAGASHASKVDAVASVAGVQISRASYRHWSRVEARLGVGGNVGHQALGFLLTSQWVLDEAAGRRLSVSEAEVKLYLARLERQRFPHAGMLRRFLASSGETEADLLARARVELLKQRIAVIASVGSSGAQAKRVLASFQQSFRDHWQSVTTCKPAYVMEDCSEYLGKGESRPVSGSQTSRSPAPVGSHTPARSSTASPPRAHKKLPRLNIEQELPRPSAGEMALSSPAFEVNGLIPPEYTCDGAGISPPLQWKNVPAKAAALILFVIDDETPGPNGGIRWIVGDIDPKTTDVAAGQTPQGGIVGANTQGHVGYSAICPARGATTRVEFDMYALSKPIALTPGFQPSVAEYEYGGSQKLIIGKVATTYGGYNRP
jgi:phosphatidylethanolamine-binding protein (PEBP) family uncharacterized protein